MWIERAGEVGGSKVGSIILLSVLSIGENVDWGKCPPLTNSGWVEEWRDEGFKGLEFFISFFSADIEHGSSKRLRSLIE